jgi:hypothetical protein
MGLDIRLPIGMLFTILGTILILFGFFNNPAIYEQSLGINVNLIWGTALAIFGAVMLWLGGRTMFVSQKLEEIDSPGAEGQK